ncbi:unnamed protein product, partial [marine sediment metagenome]
MSKKKYDFFILLQDFNKQYDSKYKISSDIEHADLIYNKQCDTFGRILYETTHSFDKERMTIKDFVYRYITHTLSNSIASCIRDFIRAKEMKDEKLEIKILPSSKIRYAYLETNYFAVTGNLGRSCMRVKDMQKALNFYVKNNVRVVVVTDSNNKIHARALLWDNVKSTKLKKPFVYLDRIYANSDAILSLFHDLAKENDWKRYYSTTVNKMDKNYYIENMDIKGMYHLPYMDTFRHLYPKDNLLTSGTGKGLNKNS